MNKEDLVVEPGLITEKQLVDLMCKLFKKYIEIRIIDDGKKLKVMLLFDGKCIDEDWIYKEEYLNGCI